jgi:hypothetical protein
MPKELNDAFELTIRRIKEQSRTRANLAMDVLKWTLLAKEQLSVDALCHAPAVVPGETKLDWDNLPPEKSLTEWCLGLVIFDKESSSIRLVHKSLFEYLDNQHEMARLFKQGENEIAQTCLIYMSFRDDNAARRRILRPLLASQ